MKKAIKAYRKAVQSWASTDVVTSNLVVAYSTIDKAAQKNIIHSRNAARKKSRLAKLSVA
jgi:ribosomal protein S20